MLDYLESLPNQVKDAFLIGSSTPFPKKFHKQIKKIIYCGMGGSGISGDLLKVFFDQTSDKSWTVLRDYRLPSWVDSSTLVVLSSYSGNTLEMKSIFREAVRRGVPLIAQTSGGWIAQACRKNRFVQLSLPAGFPPRCAIGYLTFSLLSYFASAGWIRIELKDWDEVFDAVEEFPRVEALRLAKKLSVKNIRFYGGSFLEPVALRWKTQFAENSKMLTGYGSIPEIFHHEVEGWHAPAAMIKQSLGIFFVDSNEPEWLVSKRKVAMNWMKKSGAESLLIQTRGKGLLAKIFSLIMLGDWTSYELALLNKEDPLSIKVIERIKAAEKTA